MLLYSLLLAIARNLDGNSPSGHTESIHKATHTSYMWNFRVNDGEMQQPPVVPRIMIILLTSLQAALLPPFLFSVWDQGPNPNAHYLLISWLHIQDWSIQSIIVLDFTVFCFVSPGFTWTHLQVPEMVYTVHLWAKDNDPDLLLPQIQIADLTWLAFSDEMAGRNSVQGRAKTHIFVTSGSL
jgi:hypothetical protein